MDVTFNVLDANGLPITGATCVASGGPTATTDANGSATTTTTAGGGSFSFQHPLFVREDVVFADIQTGQWNNSLVGRVAVSASAVTLQVTMGKVAVAPTVEITEGQASALALARADPAGVLLFRPPGFPATTRAYRFQWNATVAIRVAQQRLLPASAPAAGMRGWDRFQTTTSPPIPMADRGRFFWLVYPQSGPSQFVAAIWSPNVPAPQPLPALDFAVFLSPHTQAYTAKYPYGLLPAGSNPADQQYMSLGAKYLLAEFGFAAEIAAAGFPTTLVMPICRQGDWGPFASGEGLLRLLREVAVFLHRECRTSNLGTSQPGYDVNYRLAGGSLRSGTGIRDSYFGPVPPVGKIALSFFSTGAAPAKTAMGSGGLPHGYASADWGVPSGGSGSSFADIWKQAFREVWDLDGFHPATGGWPAYLTLLRGWYQADRARHFHLCHSSGRVPPPPMSYPGLLGERPGPLWTVPSRPGFGGGQELHADRWSVVTFDDAYISGGDPKIMPPLGDAHHATAAVAFAHAVTMTTIGRRSGTTLGGP